MERRGSPETAKGVGQPCKREEPMQQAKPFVIDKWEVWNAYRQVKANKGAAGIDGQSLKDFEGDLKGNLYKIWNRLSSGSYMPPPVRRVDIPKAAGGTRPLGIPTVADRIAQMVVKRRLEPHLEPLFHNNSFGYRPRKSALQAVGLARLRCLEKAWVVDVDLKGFFDSIDHELMMRAVWKHVPDRWLGLYIERWLKAPVQMPDGTLQDRERGTPQGGVISPLLANLFLHYAFDMWVVRTARHVLFERYADDIVCHCATRAQAEWFLHALDQRMRACGLQLHPEKTRLVYGRNTRRRENHEDIAVQYDFLGFRFKPRRVKRADGTIETGFYPAISPKAVESIKAQLQEWGFRQQLNWTLKQVRDYWNPRLRGWISYYGSVRRSEVGAALKHFDLCMAKWLATKYKHGQGVSLRHGCRSLSNAFERLIDRVTFMRDDWSACDALKSGTLHTYVTNNHPALGWIITCDDGQSGGLLESHRRSALLWAKQDSTIAAHAVRLARILGTGIYALDFALDSTFPTYLMMEEVPGINSAVSALIRQVGVFQVPSDKRDDAAFLERFVPAMRRPRSRS